MVENWSQPSGEGPITRALLDRVDALRGLEAEVTDLPGGLSNRNYKVVTCQGAYVLRVSSPGTGALSIDRDHEYRNTVIAASTGVGAPVVAYLPDESTMVLGYIDGITLSDASFALPGNIERVAEACRRLHEGPAFVNEFDMFEVQRRYLGLVASWIAPHSVQPY